MENKISELKQKLIQAGDLYLKIKAKPQSAKTVLVSILEDGTWKIDIAAPPVKGKANKELISYLSELLGVAENNIIIVSGLTSRDKLVHIYR